MPFLPANQRMLAPSRCSCRRSPARQQTTFSTDPTAAEAGTVVLSVGMIGSVMRALRLHHVMSHTSSLACLTAEGMRIQDTMVLRHNGASHTRSPRACNARSHRRIWSPAGKAAPSSRQWLPEA